MGAEILTPQPKLLFKVLTNRLVIFFLMKMKLYLYFLKYKCSFINFYEFSLYRIREQFRLEKTCKVIGSNHKVNPANSTTKPYP